MMKCDLWSIGVILFILFFGSTPYNGTNVNKLVKDIIKGKLKCKSDHKLPEIVSFIEFVKLLLNNKPVERLDATRALDHVFLNKPLNRSIVLTKIVLEKTKNTLIKHQMLNQLKN